MRVHLSALLAFQPPKIIFRPPLKSRPSMVDTPLVYHLRERYDTAMFLVEFSGVV